MRSDDKIRFYALDVDELLEPWHLFMSPGARCAWVYLKAYVKDRSYSQKRPNEAPALDPRAASQQWNVPVDAVVEIVREACAAGALRVVDGDWVVVERLIYQDPRTVRRVREQEKAEREAEEFKRRRGKPKPAGDLSDKSGDEPPKEADSGSKDAPDLSDKSEDAPIPVDAPAPDLSASSSKAPHVADKRDKHGRANPDPDPNLDPHQNQEAPPLDDVSAPALEMKDGFAYWDRDSTTEPMRSVAKCLCRVHEHMGQAPPDESKIKSHMAARAGCRRVVDAVGWAEAARIYVYAVDVENMTSWAPVANNWETIQYKMSTPQQARDRAPRKAPAPPPQADGTAESRSARRTRLMTGQNP